MSKTLFHTLPHLPQTRKGKKMWNLEFHDSNVFMMTGRKEMTRLFLDAPGLRSLCAAVERWKYFFTLKSDTILLVVLDGWSQYRWPPSWPCRNCLCLVVVDDLLVLSTSSSARLRDWFTWPVNKDLSDVSQRLVFSLFWVNSKVVVCITLLGS